MIDDEASVPHAALLLPALVPAANLAFSAFAFQSGLYQIHVASGAVALDHWPMDPDDLDQGLAVEEELPELGDIESPEIEEAAIAEAEPEQVMTAESAEAAPEEPVAQG